jgi:hypothetical protein
LGIDSLWPNDDYFTATEQNPANDGCGQYTGNNIGTSLLGDVFSVGIWTKDFTLYPATTQAAIWQYRRIGDQDAGISLHINSVSHKLILRYRGAADTWIYWTSADNQENYLTEDVWHNWIVRRNGADWGIFRDGIELSGSWTGSQSSSFLLDGTDWYIGFFSMFWSGGTKLGTYDDAWFATDYISDDEIGLLQYFSFQDFLDQFAGADPLGGYENGMGTIGYALTLPCIVGSDYCGLEFEYSLKDAGTKIYLDNPPFCFWDGSGAIASATLPYFTNEVEMSMPTSSVATTTRYNLAFYFPDGSVGCETRFKIFYFSTSTLDFPSVNDPWCECEATTTLDSIFCGLKKLACWAVIPPEDITIKLSNTIGKARAIFPFSVINLVDQKVKSWEDANTATTTNQKLTVHIGTSSSGIREFDVPLLSSSTFSRLSVWPDILTAADAILWLLAIAYIVLRIITNKNN